MCNAFLEIMLFCFILDGPKLWTPEEQKVRETWRSHTRVFCCIIDGWGKASVSVQLLQTGERYLLSYVTCDHTSVAWALSCRRSFVPNIFISRVMCSSV